MVDGLRLLLIIGAGTAIILYARAAALYKNRHKGGLPAAYMPSNLALVVALLIVIIDLIFRVGDNATWRAGAYTILVVLTHWSFDRMGMTPWRRQRRGALPMSAATVRVMRQVEALGEAVFSMDIQGTCTDVNGIGVNLLGYSRHEMIGQNMHALSHYKKPDGTPYPPDECPLSQAIRTGQAILNTETTLWNKDGEPVPCLFSATPVIEDGEITGAVVVFSEKVGTYGSQLPV